MTYASQTSDASFSWELTTVMTAVFVLVIAFWASVGIESLGISIPFVRTVSGLALLTFVPGAMLTRLLGIQNKGIGEFVIFSIGLSIVLLSITAVVVSVVFPPLGITEPLSFVWIAGLLTALVVVFALATWIRDEGQFRVRIPLPPISPTYAFVWLLPVLAALGAVLMNWYDVAVGMGLFVVATAIVTVLAATRAITTRQYPAVVFSVALSVILHRNLAATHVVGADIQYNYFLSETIAETNLWAPELGSALASLPIVTTVPVVYTVVTGLELTTVFTVVYPVVFSFAPLGIYYLANDVFDDNIALFGTLFFVFYHGTFYLTPGKQRLSEFFLVLLLLLYFRHGLDRRSEKVVAGLLAVGLVHSHYGTTYVFGLSLLAVSIGLFLARRFVDGFEQGFSPTYPVAFLLGGTYWYAYASSDVVRTLGAIPQVIFVQLASLPEGISPRAGGGYVQAQETLLQQVNLSLYILLSVLLALGLAWWTVVNLDRIRREDATDSVEFTAIALPFFGFLGVSFFLDFGLWADRMYQMVLPVLAHFAAFGFLLVGTVIERDLGLPVPGWSPLGVVLAALFVINAGLVGAVVGAPTDYTFDENAHDYAFTDEEREAAEWLEAQSEVERVDRLGDDAGSEREDVRIYTDRITTQLLRAVVPADHYNVEVTAVKHEWEPDPTFDPEETSDGYVFIRHRAVEDTAPEDTPLSSLSKTQVNELIEERSIAYENDDITILEPTDEANADGETAESLTPETSSSGR